ncbi:alpha-glucosidase [Faecalicatena contorta]|uniref:TIM-barrel domain-containing protein n=1 Tax=Clostridia TaxID=186801 RepID=UPI00051ADF5C|nr:MULTISPECIES: TIM-barrel domain-containing protein [Clostridia]MBM6686337.1 alpha-glucosidase [Faecalicatena contorta]MBM6711680.1 alpha-glucosidase [Faecalicatena contorta]
MIRKYTFGNPFPTEAVVKEIPASEGALPYFTREGDSLVLTMEEGAPVYGLGEQVRGINKRGWSYTSNCSDDPHHLETTHSLYGAHNFLMIGGSHPFGLFIDYPGYLTFDIGYTQKDTLRITPTDWDLDIYVIEKEDRRFLSIVHTFRQMIGRSYIPPKWAFGYGQSRWGYRNEADVREVAAKYKEAGIPLDAIYMDIDYMERYEDFTVSAEKFPDLPGLAADMKKEGIHLVPIIDAGVKIEEGYSVYEEGVEKGYFCKEEDGTDFVGAVWPGRAHFPDMLNPAARRWFGLKYRFLLDQGIDGFWNDMNEPAIFYSEKRLNKVFDEVASMKGQNLDLDKNNHLLGLVNTLANNPEDYQSFYHEPGNGLPRIRHDKVHNLYGYNMTRAAGEAFEELEPDKRILMFSRSSYIGMHRYGGIWQGDNLSWWSHLLMNVKMMPSLSMCGFLYTGADLAGFGADTTEDLVMRWLQFGIFTPLMRNHSAMGTRMQEAYRFSNAEALGRIIKLRYCLLPYLYSEYMKAALGDEMLFLPLSFAYPEDPHAAQVEDQLLLGESLMLAPVCQQNAAGRYVYLPEDMLCVTTSGPDDFRCEKMGAGHHYVPVAENELIFFVRRGHLLPLAQTARNVEKLDASRLQLIAYPAGTCRYTLYDDDGYGKDYENPAHLSTIDVSADGEVRYEGSTERTVTTCFICS